MSCRENVQIINFFNYLLMVKKLKICVFRFLFTLIEIFLISACAEKPSRGDWFRPPPEGESFSIYSVPESQISFVTESMVQKSTEFLKDKAIVEISRKMACQLTDKKICDDNDGNIYILRALYLEIKPLQDEVFPEIVLGNGGHILVDSTALTQSKAIPVNRPIVAELPFLPTDVYIVSSVAR